MAFIPAAGLFDVLALLRPRIDRPNSLDEIIRSARMRSPGISDFDESGSGGIHVEIAIAHATLARIVAEAAQDAAPLLQRCGRHLPGLDHPRDKGQVFGAEPVKRALDRLRLGWKPSLACSRSVIVVGEVFVLRSDRQVNTNMLPALDTDAIARRAVAMALDQQSGEVHSHGLPRCPGFRGDLAGRGACMLSGLCPG